MINSEQNNRVLVMEYYFHHNFTYTFSPIAIAFLRFLTLNPSFKSSAKEEIFLIFIDDLSKT